MRLFSTLVVVFFLALSIQGCGEADRNEEQEPKSFLFLDFFRGVLGDQDEPDFQGGYQYKYQVSSKVGYDKATCLRKGGELIGHFNDFEPVHQDILCSAKGFIFVKWYIGGTLITTREANLIGVGFAREIDLKLVETIAIESPQCPDDLTNRFDSDYEIDGFIYAPFGNTFPLVGSLTFHHYSNYYLIFNKLTVNGDTVVSDQRVDDLVVDGRTIKASLPVLLPGKMFNKQEDIPAVVYTTSELSKDYRLIDGSGFMVIESMPWLKITTEYDGKQTGCTDYGLATQQNR